MPSRPDPVYPAHLDATIADLAGRYLLDGTTLSTRLYRQQRLARAFKTTTGVVEGWPRGQALPRLPRVRAEVVNWLEERLRS